MLLIDKIVARKSAGSRVRSNEGGAAGAESCETPPMDVYHDRIDLLLSEDTPPGTHV